MAKIKADELQQILFHEEAEDRHVRKLVKRINKKSILSKIRKRKTQQTLPEALIGSIFSINVRPKTWTNVLENFREYAKFDAMDNSERKNFSLEDLIVLCGRPKDFETKMFRNSHRTSPRSGITKSKAVLDAAQALLDCNVSTARELENSKKILDAFRLFRKVHGQTSGVTYVFMLMLLGHADFVKPDRRIQMYCTKVLGENRTFRPSYCAELVRQAAYVLKLRPADLDLVLFESGVK